MPIIHIAIVVCFVGAAALLVVAAWLALTGRWREGAWVNVVALALAVVGWVLLKVGS